MNDTAVMNLPEISISQMLPFGFALKPLLNDSCLTDSDLNNILKSRGVFLGNTEKKSTIPLIVAMVLSPKEFEMLQERQKTKESNPKHRNSTVQSKSVNTLVTAISKFNIAVDIIEEMNDIELITPMNFATLSENHLQLVYSIIHKDLTMDWVCPSSRHTGKVEIKKNDGSNTVEICNEYTSKETDDINKQVIKNLLSFLKEKQEVDDKIKTVSANDANKDHLIFRSLEAKYEFNHKGTKGFCQLQYGFMHFFRNQNTSQEFQVALLTLNSKSINKTALNNFVLEQFEQMKKKILQQHNKLDNH